MSDLDRSLGPRGIPKASRIPALPADVCTGATTHVLGGVEVLQLRDGRLFRFCTESEADCWFPKRSTTPARPVRAVHVVDGEAPERG